MQILTQSTSWIYEYTIKDKVLIIKLYSLLICSLTLQLLNFFFLYGPLLVHMLHACALFITTLTNELQKKLVYQ